MGRLPAGKKPEPLNARLTRYRQELEESGGHRLIVDIEKPAHDALHLIMEREDPANAERGVTKKEAVTNALLHYAKSLSRRKR